MMMISRTARGLARRAGMMAIAALAVTAVSHDRAEALSLTSPAALPSAKHASDGMTIEVRGGHHGGGGFRGGGGGFRGGGFHGGGGVRGFHGGGGFRGFHGGGLRAAHVHRGGGFRAAPIYRGGGYHRFGGHGVHRHAYHRPVFHRRHFHHRRHFAPAYYGYYPRYYRPYRACRVVWTYWGPRRICRPPYWHRHHHWNVRYW